MRWKLILILMGIGVLIIGSIFMLNKMQVTSLLPESKLGVVSASSFNPEDERLIGYELLDNGKVVHIWNTQDDYFFNKSSGIQFTNHYQEYWTKNVFCIGYYDGEEWIKIKCADELNGFTKIIDTDNETYVNATLWKDITYGSYDMRLGVNYYLGLDDGNLSITIYGKNIGIDIPFDLGFAWKIANWDIPPSESEDYIKINNTNYLISSINYDTIFTNMDNTFIKGFDNRESLRVDWDENLNYAVKMFGDGIVENFYVALLINAGTFSAGQEKSTTFYWIDLIAVDAISDGTDDGTVTLTVPHTTTGTTTKGILIVTIQVTDSSDTDRVINNVTYNNVELTHLSADADDTVEERTEIWYLANPEEGENLDIVVTADGSCTDLTLGAISLIGVNTTASTFVVQNATGDSTPPTLDITTEGTSSYVIDSLASMEREGGKIATGTAGGQIIHKTDVGGDTHASTYVDAGGAGVQTMNYTDQDQDTSWVMSAVAIQAVPVVEWNQTSLNLGESTNNITSIIEIDSFGANTDVVVDCVGNCTEITTNWTQSSMSNGESDAVLITCSNATEGSFSADFNVTSDEDSSSNFINVTCEIFSYGWLNISIQKPDDDSEWYQNDVNLTVNATVTCEGSSNAKCGTVEALARYNLSASPDTKINVTTFGTPFYIIPGGYFNWNVFDEEGDSQTDGDYPLLGDHLDDRYHNTSIAFISDTSFTATEISVNIGFTTGSDYISSAEVYICNFSNDICTTDKCSLVNNTFNPVWSTGWQTFSISSYSIIANVNYTVIFVTPNTNSNSAIDVLWVSIDTSSILYRASNWYNTEVCSDGYETYYGEINISNNFPDIGNPQSTTLSQGESYQFNWTLNVTTATASAYEIDVLFNSTTYYPSITENHTEDRQVNLNPSAVDTDSPKWYDNSTNSTVAGTFVKHNVRWTDAGLSGYIFSFNNGSGTFANDTWVSMTGTNNWSNVSKIANYTVGSTIQWQVYANDTAENGFNATDVFQYDTTTADTCSCPSINTDWEIDLSDYCIISSVCDIGTGNITFTATGNITFNTTITALDYGDLPASQRGWVTSNAEVFYT